MSDSDNSQNSNNKDNNVKVKRKRATKNDMYKKEQAELFIKLKKSIKYDEQNCCFLGTNIDIGEMREIYDDVKKYFHSKNWATINIDSYQGPTSLIRNIFKCNNFEMASKNVHGKDKDGNKNISKKYFIIEKEI